MRTDNIEVTLKAGKHEFSKTGTKQVAESLQDAVTIELNGGGLTNEQAERNVVKNYNYGKDLEVRRGIRAELQKEVDESPVGQIEEATELLVKNGMKYEEARNIVVTSRKQNGLPV